MVVSSDAIALTVVCGFLGSGKTSAINRVLRGTRGVRIGVLVNEFGTIGVDGALLRGQGGDILELAGGCVCCQIGDDLRQATLDLVAYARPDHVILETTGIAEPDQVLEQLEDVPGVEIAGVVCTADAAALPGQLGVRKEVAHQISAAGRLMLTKLDRATADELLRTHAALDALGYAGERAAFPGTADDPLLARWIMEAQPGRLGRRPTKHTHAQGHEHEHGTQLSAIAVAIPQPALEKPLLRVLEGLGPNVYRVKGLLRLHGELAPTLVELAGGRVELRRDVPLGADDRARAEDPEGAAGSLVIIGEGLDEPCLRRQFAACGVAG
jgi:G3E family GTPase